MKDTNDKFSDLARSIKSGDPKSLARAISIVENDLEGAKQLLSSLEIRPIPIIGITGPPGAGKSTLINALLQKIVSENKKVAVVAVDPTSPFNFGSLLGDRLRMAEHFTNDQVFIRSIATRGSLGGLSEKVIEICDLLRTSDFDYILVETVGVGQSEVEVAGLADTTVVILVPESGDTIQALKSGIMEIADIFVVNKSDREGASLFAGNLKNILPRSHDIEWEIPVIKCVATTGDGVDELFNSIKAHTASGVFNKKKVYLLSEKAYRLISHKKMQGISREDLFQILQKEVKEPDFNLYRFVDQFKN